MKKLSLIIATYNRAAQVIETLRSIVAQSAPASLWECVVVNNNSTDDTIEAVEQFITEHRSFDIRLVTETKQGLSHARNCGIDNSSAPIIAIIDDDELILPPFIASYIDFFETHPHVASAGGGIVAVYRSERPRWMTKYTEIPIANPIDLGDTPRPFPSGKIPGGGNMAIRRAAIERYGAFDPELGRRGESLIGGEESNLFQRLREGGEECWWVPNAVMHHLIPNSKLGLDYLTKLWFNIGVSAARRGEIEGVGQLSVRLNEAAKWCATLLLSIIYIVSLAPSRAKYLILMRHHITRGIYSFRPSK
ncbi:MAG: glycosyltransferase [Rikenellaceae bacterium]